MKKVILVIEDDKSISSDLETLLTFEGYAVICAANGADALEHLTLPPFLEHQILPVFVKWLLPSRHAFLQTQQA